MNGKVLAAEIRESIRKKIVECHGKKPGLAFILVGENEASKTYVRSKKQACKEAGIESTVIELAESVSESELLAHIHKLNQDPKIHGILCQLPLPSHLSPVLVTRTIDPEKDVDGFHPLNVGKMLLGDEDGFLPCTPNGIRVLLEHGNIDVSGKHVVIVGRSNIVGKPLGAILVQKKQTCNATVTIAHSGSENLNELTRSADILIAAIGRPLFIRKEMVKKGSVVVDVGINRVQGKLVGDVDFEEVSKVARAVSPVPGGVGPMTIAMLLQNTLRSFLRTHPTYEK